VQGGMNEKMTNKEKYNERLRELVEKLFEDSRYLLESTRNNDVSLSANISHLKGYVEALED